MIRYIYNVEDIRRSFECLIRKKGKTRGRIDKDRHEYMIHTYTRIYVHYMYVYTVNI